MKLIHNWVNAVEGFIKIYDIWIPDLKEGGRICIPIFSIDFWKHFPNIDKENFDNNLPRNPDCHMFRLDYLTEIELAKVKQKLL